jgi:hypothetical protein
LHGLEIWLMSVVVDRFPAPQGVTAERPLWRVRRAGRTASAFERIYSDRSEVRVHIGADIPLRRVFGDADAAHRHATDLLSQFERQGWTADEVAGAIWHILQSST